MKWLIFSLLLMFPVVGYTEPLAGRVMADRFWYKEENPTPPHVLYFEINADQNLDSLRASMRVYVPLDTPLEVAGNGSCLLSVNKEIQSDLRDHLIYGENGPELWLPHLGHKDFARLIIMWTEKDFLIHYASIFLQSAQGGAFDRWRSNFAERAFKKRPDAQPKELFRSLSLDEVCGSYVTEDLTEVDFP